jgi:hypothetical protein
MNEGHAAVGERARASKNLLRLKSESLRRLREGARGRRTIRWTE